ncbi:unnamed protein product [Toxocara canis]|uniref:EF hand n=1 Tax=Toxocara canis TaxID=6265 RepID=A0A183UWB2_TOXCA|nr:unnamed protein product [Toxocara canis]
MYRIVVFIVTALTAIINSEQSPQLSVRDSKLVPSSTVSLKGASEVEQKPSQSKGISLEQLLAFTSGLLAADVVEMSFKLADKNNDGLLDNDEAQRASIIGNVLAQHRVQEQLTEAEKNEDGLIELDEAKLVAQRVGIDDIDAELSAAVDKDALLTAYDVEQVLNTNANRTPLNAIFGRFDEDSDGSWTREEIDKFISVMRIDRQKWLKALKASAVDDNTLHELRIDGNYSFSYESLF